MEIQDDTATVFFGDHGDDDVVYLNQIKVLEPNFKRLPAQVCIIFYTFMFIYVFNYNVFQIIAMN